MNQDTNGWILMFLLHLVPLLQLLLCFICPKIWGKLLPTLLLVVLMGLCILSYGLSGWVNWGWLVLGTYVFSLLALDGLAWAAYGILSFAKNKLLPSRRNT